MENILAGVAGITADANSLVNYARMQAQKYLYTYDDNIPVEQLTQRLCDLKQGYTQYGGLRPFGVSLLYAGHDMHHGFQLYHSDPSGNYSGWKATCVGANNGTAQSLLKQDYREGVSLWSPAPDQQDETEGSKCGAVELACKVLGKTLDATTIDSDKGEYIVNSLTLFLTLSQSNSLFSNSTQRLVFLRARSSRQQRSTSCSSKLVSQTRKTKKEWTFHDFINIFITKLS